MEACAKLAQGRSLVTACSSDQHAQAHVSRRLSVIGGGQASKACARPLMQACTAGCHAGAVWTECRLHRQALGQPLCGPLESWSRSAGACCLCTHAPLSGKLETRWSNFAPWAGQLAVSCVCAPHCARHAHLLPATVRAAHYTDHTAQQASACREAERATKQVSPLPAE